MTILQIIGHGLMGAGAFFLFASGLGVLRMPDAWNRMHAGTKATTLGTLLFLLGLGCIEPTWLPKLLLIIILVIITNPISSHALARALHMRSDREHPGNLGTDDLSSEGQESDREVEG